MIFARRRYALAVAFGIVADARRMKQGLQASWPLVMNKRGLALDQHQVTLRVTLEGKRRLLRARAGEERK